MKITYLYNSGFALEQGSTLLLFDVLHMPGRDTLELGGVGEAVLRQYEHVYVFASHSHFDHFDKEILRWHEIHSGLKYVLSSDIHGRARSVPSAVFLAPGDAWGDGAVRVKAFGSTDAGVSFLVRWERRCIFHAGDLNFWSWRAESTDQEIREMKTAFDAVLDALAPQAGLMDAAMFPVDPRMGEGFHEGADIFIQRFRPALFVPMHFRGDFWAVDDFIKAHPDKAASIWRISHAGQSLEF